MRTWLRVLLSVAAVLPAVAQAQEGSKVEKCGKSFGTLTVVDPRTGLGALQQYGLGSPAALLRLMVQESGCFDVVERGAGMQAMQQERALAQGGALREDSNVGQGQMQVADFVMTPDVQIPASTTGGIGGALGGLGGKLGGILGAVAGGLKFKEVTTSLLVADVRSGIQVAGAEGKAERTDFSLGGWGFSGVGVGALGGYTSSPEGKLVAAGLLDNFNKVVLSIRDKPTLIRPTTAASTQNAQSSTRAETPIQAGQLLRARIGNVRLLAEPSASAQVVASLRAGEEMVAAGESRDGFVRVDASAGSGWVQRTLVGPGGVAPTATAQQPIPAARQQVVVLPNGLIAGSFSGSLAGADQGNFRVIVSPSGKVSGDGAFARLGAFGLTGHYDAASGELQMSGGASGGMVGMTGRFDPSRGAIVGTWLLVRGVGIGNAGGTGGEGGSFNAVLQ